MSQPRSELRADAGILERYLRNVPMDECRELGPKDVDIFEYDPDPEGYMQPHSPFIVDMGSFTTRMGYPPVVFDPLEAVFSMDTFRDCEPFRFKGYHPPTFKNEANYFSDRKILDASQDSSDREFRAQYCLFRGVEGSKTIHDRRYFNFQSKYARRRQYSIVSDDLPDELVGDAAMRCGTLYGPGKGVIERGRVVNWRIAEKLWSHGLRFLTAPSEEGAVVLTFPINTPRNDIEKMTCIWFETFNVRAVLLANAPTCALFASGSTNGIVVDVGHDSTSVTVLDDGYGVLRPASTNALTAVDVQKRMATLTDVTFHEKKANMRVAKERFCRLEASQEDVDSKAKRKESHPFVLSDGKKIDLGNSVFLAPEILFRPELVGKSKDSGLAFVVIETLRKCVTSPEKRASFLRKVFLVGGSKFIPGLRRRLQSELQLLTPHRVEVHSRQTKHLSWVGASILPLLQPYANNWITSPEYDDCGATIIRHKTRMILSGDSARWARSVVEMCDGEEFEFDVHLEERSQFMFKTLLGSSAASAAVNISSGGVLAGVPLSFFVTQD